MEAAPAATPPNPKIAAIIATIRNITDQRSIKKDFKVRNVSISTHNLKKAYPELPSFYNYKGKKLKTPWHPIWTITGI